MTSSNDFLGRVEEILDRGGVGKLIVINTALNDGEEQKEHILGVDRIMISKSAEGLFHITLGERGAAKDFSRFVRLSMTPKVLDAISHCAAATTKGGRAAVELPENLDNLDEYDCPRD